MSETTTWTRENLWKIHADAERKAEERGRWLNEGEGFCTACGRKVGASVLVVEVSIDGDVILPGDPRSGGMDSQGCWDLGSECAKRVLTADERKMIRAAAKAA